VTFLGGHYAVSRVYLVGAHCSSIANVLLERLLGSSWLDAKVLLGCSGWGLVGCFLSQIRSQYMNGIFLGDLFYQLKYHFRN